MKKFMEGVMEWKSSVALMFSASVILCIVIMLFYGETSIPITAIIFFLVLSMIGTLLQFLAFSDRVIKKMRYTYRMVVFVIPFIALLTASAWFFHWFPEEYAAMWLICSCIFTVVFIGGTVAFEIYYRVMGKKYDGLLGRYRIQKELDNK